MTYAWTFADDILPTLVIYLVAFILVGSAFLASRCGR